MPEFNAPILAFNRGIVDKRAMARTDLARLAWSAETQLNFMPRALGSMSLRPGLEYIDTTDSSNQAKHIPFIKRTVSDQAILEITNTKMRVRVSDSILQRESVSSSITNGAFTSDITGWTDSDEVGGTSAWVTGGYMGLTGNGTAAAIRDQQVTVSVGDQGTAHGLAITVERGPVLFRVGSTQGDDDYVAETTLGTGVHSFGFTPTGDFHIRFFSRLTRQVLVDSVAVESSGDLTLTTPWTTSDLANIRYDQSGDVVFVACDTFQQRRIERRDNDSWSVVLYQPEDGPFLAENTGPTTITASAITGNITLTASNGLFRSGDVGELFRISSAGQRVQADISAENNYTDDIRVTGTGASRQFSIEITGTWVGTITLQRSIEETGNWEDVSGYKWSGNTTTTYNDGLSNQIVFYRIGINTGDYTSGTASLALDYAIGSITGVVRITAVASETSASAEVITDLGGTDATAFWSEGVWSDYRGWPTTVVFNEGRLWWFGRDRVIGSVSDAYESFDDEIEGESAPIIRSLASGPTDFINWAASVDRLIIGAEGSEISARSSSFDEIMTSTNFNLKDTSTLGSAAMDAVKIDRNVVFVHRDTKSVFLLSQASTLDYSASDLTLLCPDIGLPGIAQIVVQRRPDTRIHCRRTDGTVAVMILYPEENIRCWVEMETDGTVEDIVVMPGATEDTVYYTVNRTINSSTVRYLEKWALEADSTIYTTIYSGASTTSITDLGYADNTEVTIRDSSGTKIENLTVSSGAITLSTATTYARITPSIVKLADSFYAYSGSATSTITGLSHLEGESVVVFADGMALRDSSGNIATFTVASGQITLTDLGSSVSVEEAIVGLTYYGKFKGSKLAFSSALGTALGQPKRVSSIGLIGVDMHYQGLKYGSSFNSSDLQSMPLIVAGAEVIADMVYETYDFDQIPFPGNTDTDARICLQAQAPRPATLIGVVPGMRTDDKAP